MSAGETQADPRWALVCARDLEADGTFFYAVATTGVYCRPSCASRRARPENVSFFDTSAAAERAGFRPCKRCKPDTTPGEASASQTLVVALCRLIENSEQPPTLAVLAKHAGLSTFHTQRLFKAATGLTPRAYAAAHRDQRLRESLDANTTVTNAIYAAGYNSAGRFYERSNERLGMTPSKYKSGGTSVSIRFAIGDCSLGAILVASSERGVCAILLGDDAAELIRDLERRFPHAELIGADAAFEGLVATVVGLVEAPGKAHSLPLDIRGTAFQERVWQALMAIPCGATMTYSQIAAALGKPSATRAVAGACAANRIAVAIPCHRVIRTDGELSGYRWGIDRKRELLDREAKSEA